MVLMYMPMVLSFKMLKVAWWEVCSMEKSRSSLHRFLKISLNRSGSIITKPFLLITSLTLVSLLQVAQTVNTHISGRIPEACLACHLIFWLLQVHQ